MVDAAPAIQQVGLVEIEHTGRDHRVAERVLERVTGNVRIIRDGVLLGVLDLDSPVPARFDAEDAAGFEALVAVYVEALAG